MMDVNKLDDLRMFAMAAPYLLPMLERRKHAAMKKLTSQYRNAKDLHGVAAEITVLDDLENELRRKHIELQSMQGE